MLSGLGRVLTSSQVKLGEVSDVTFVFLFAAGVALMLILCCIFMCVGNFWMVAVMTLILTCLIVTAALVYQATYA